MTAQSLLAQVVLDVVATFRANGVYLVLSVVLASAIQVFVGTDRLARWLRARTPVAVAGAVVLGALTPFCSCGTTAVVLGALASSVPWAPIVAFLVSSPLTSPGEYVLSVGLFGSPFATVYFGAALVLGLVAGWVAHRLEGHGLLRDQQRVRPPAATAPALAPVPAPVLVAAATVPATTASAERVDQGGCGTDCGTASTDPAPAADAPGTGARGLAGGLPGPARRFASALLANGRRLAILFFGFTALGYLLIRLVPTAVLTTLLGDDSAFAVPLAALLGIPVYLSSDGSLPLVASLMDGGMGSGAAMAFLITGAGTSVGAVSGMLLIARWRVVALVVAVLLAGAVVTGYVVPGLV